MGATDEKVQVDAERFGEELEEVFSQIMAIQPTVEVTAVTGAGDVIEDLQVRV